MLGRAWYHERAVPARCARTWCSRQASSLNCGFSIAAGPPNCSRMHADCVARRRLAGSKVEAFSLHPGVIQTPLGRHIGTQAGTWVGWLFGFLGAYYIKSAQQARPRSRGRVGYSIWDRPRDAQSVTCPASSRRICKSAACARGRACSCLPNAHGRSTSAETCPLPPRQGPCARGEKSPTGSFGRAPSA